MSFKIKLKTEKGLQKIASSCQENQLNNMYYVLEI